MKKLLIATLTVLLSSVLAQAGTVYYISKSGNNSANGLSWGSAWLTVNHADSTLSGHGDTIVIGTGIWYGTNLRVPTGGGPTNWEVYCCSSFYEYARGAISYDQAVAAKYVGGKYRSWITSANRYTGWSYYGMSGGDTIWQHATSEGKAYPSWGPNFLCLTQGWTADEADTQLTPQSTLARVNFRGACYYTGSGGTGTIYCIPFGAQNPNQASITMMAASLPTIGYCFRSGGLTSYVRTWGLRVTHGNQGVILYNTGDGPSSAGTCSTFTEHCFLEFGSFQNTENPGIVMSRCSRTSDTTQYYRWTILRNDSLAWSVEVDGAPTSPTSGFTGGAIVTYDAWHWRIDSCVFTGNPISGNMIRGVHFKNDDYVKQTLRDYRDNQVTNSYFKNMKGCAVQADCYPTDDSVYGNICVGGRYFFFADVASGGTRPTALWVWREVIAHNTIYGGDAAAFCWFLGETSNPCSNTGANKFFGNAISDSQASVSLYAQFDYCTNWYQWFSVIDYNKWYNVPPLAQPTSPFKVAGANRTFAVWQATYGFDAHGTNGTSMGFDSVNAANPWLGFKRSNASGETHDTLGGKVFTVIGAVQPTSTAPTEACPAASLLTPSTTATVTSLPVTLYFSSADGDGDSMNTRLLLDTSNPPTTLKAQDTVSSAEGVKTAVIGGLVNNTRYYWRTTAADTIDGRAAADCIDTSVVFYFDTDTTTSQTVARRGVFIHPGGPQ